MHYFLSWETLATICGASILVVCITQLLKQKLCKIPTQIVSYIISLIIMLLANFILENISIWQDFVLIGLNAMLVSLAANGEHGVIKRFIG